MTPGLDLESALTTLAQQPADESAWRELHKQAWPLVLAYCYRSLGGVHELAEDASQEVFVRLVKYARFSELQDPARFVAYTRMVALNVCRQILARSSATESLELVVGQRAVEGSREAEAELYLEANELLQRILQDLNESDRQIVKMMVRGYTLPNIADALEISYPAAAVRVHRLRATLKQALD